MFVVRASVKKETLFLGDAKPLWVGKFRNSQEEGLDMLGKLYIKWWQFKHDRSAVTAVEYGVIAAAIVVGIVTLIYSVGGKIETAFTTLDTEVK